MRRRTYVVVGIAAALLAGAVLAQAIPNWSAPPTWTPPRGGMTASAMSDLSGPVPFIPVTPCRVADTRGNGFTGAYGPPALVSGGDRTFTITGQCGIPTGAVAVSFNFTIVGTTTAGDIRVYPAGGTLPLVSTQNWTASTSVIANAAVVPLGSGGITVHLDGAGSVNLIIDVNGYYARYINSSEYFGVIGNYPGGVIFGENDTTGGGYGVRGQVPSGGAGAAGVLGEYLGSAAGFGVKGISSSAANNAAGVMGVDSDTTVPVPNAVRAGVIGLSGDGIAVYAMSRNAPVWASLVDGSNITQAYAVLGWSNSAVYAVNSSNITAGNAAVDAYSAGASPSYGVRGTTTTLGGADAGVRGQAGAVPAAADTMWSWAGVRGLGTNFGVLGISTTLGVGGFHHNASTGAEESGSFLGFSSTTGLWTVGNTGASGVKSFVEPYPTDPTKVIKYVALEGPEAGTYFRGKGRITGGQAIIEVPETFRMVTDQDGLSVQVTPIGRSVAVAVISYDLNAIVVESTRDVEFFYLVQGVRKAFKDFQVVQENIEYKPMSVNDMMPTGLASEQKSTLIRTGIYNQDGTVNVDTAERLGWVQQWKERDDANMKAAAEEAAKLAANSPRQSGGTKQQP